MYQILLNLTSRCHTDPSRFRKINWVLLELTAESYLTTCVFKRRDKTTS